MKSGRTVLVLLLMAAAAAAGWFAHREYAPQNEAAAPAAEAEGPEVPPVARVRVVPLQVEAIDETLAALGTVEAAPGETQTLSVPFESRVSRVLVVSGQSVEADEALIEVEPSPDTVLGADQARQERDAAKGQLAVAQQRQEMKLSTRQEVLLAEQALEAAELRLASLEKRGIDGKRALHAAAAGIVSQIDVQPGQIVPAGGPLLETIGEDQIAVRLGIESTDAGRVQPGMSVKIQPVNDAEAAFAGRVRRVSREVSPETRLISVIVTPAPGARLLLNQYVRGVVAVATRQGLVAPPAAVLPEGDASVLYTVQDGQAVRHEVKVGLQNAQQVELVGADLQAGQMAVVVGNSELEDGMAVRGGAGAMKFTEWVQSHHRSILFLLAAFALAGVASSFDAAGEPVPQGGLPARGGERGGRGPAGGPHGHRGDAARSRRRCARCPACATVRSTTSRGSADISHQLRLGPGHGGRHAPGASRPSTRSATRCPPGTTFEVRRMDPTVFPVLGYSLTSDNHSLGRAARPGPLPDSARAVHRGRRVAASQVQGGEESEYQVAVDPAKLAAFGLTLEDVGGALSAANVITAVGRLEEHDKLYLVVSEHPVHGPRADRRDHPALRPQRAGAAPGRGHRPARHRAPVDARHRRRARRRPLPGLPAAGRQHRPDRQGHHGEARPTRAAPAGRRPHRQLVRPERADPLLGRQRARRGAHRRRAGGR